MTLDPAFMNTASTKSAITFIDGDKGILRYRGIPIEQLAEKSTFVEVGLPADLRRAAHRRAAEPVPRPAHAPHADPRGHEELLRGLPATAHPMAILSAMVSSLSTYYPEARPTTRACCDITIARLMSK